MRIHKKDILGAARISDDRLKKAYIFFTIFEKNAPNIVLRTQYFHREGYHANHNI